MSREFQVYQGAEPQAAQVHVQDAPSIPALPNYSKIVQSSIDHVLEMGEHYAKLHDAGEDQRIESERDTLNTELNTELRTAAQGSGDDYLFRADGTVNTDKRDAIIAKYQEKSRAIQGNHWLEVGAQRFAGEQNAQDRKITADVVSFTELSRISKSKDALNNNYRLAMEQGRFDDAARLAQMGSGTLVSESEAQLMEYGAGQAGLYASAERLSRESPDDFVEAYDRGEYDNAGPEVRAKIEHLMRNVYTAEHPSAARVSRDSSGKLSAEPPEAPSNLPSSMVKLWNDYQGAFKDNPDAQQQAMGTCAAWARSQITKPDDAQEEATVKAVFRQYGLSEGYADDIIKGLRAEIDGGAYKPEGAFKRIEPGMFFKPENRKYFAGLQERQRRLSAMGKASLGKKSGVYDAAGNELTNAELLNQTNAAVKRWGEYDKAEREKAASAVDGRFQAWRVRNPKATYREQARQYWTLVDEYRKGFAPNESVESWEVVKQEEEVAGAYDAKLARARNERRAAAEANARDVEATNEARAEMRSAAAGAEATAMTHPVEMSLSSRGRDTQGFEGNREESVVYVPAGSEVADGAVISVQRGDRVSMARVKHVEGIGSAMMSQRLRRNIGALLGGYDGIRFDGNKAVISAQRGLPSVNGDLSVDRAKAAPASADRLGGLAPYRQAFIDAGNKYGIDPNFLMAISMNETGRGTSRVFREQHNAMGVYDHAAGRSRTFSSVAESIDYMAGQLRKNYFDKGLVSIARIGAKYAPVGAANDPRGLNGGWVPTVTRFYNELSR